jgi:hypothetical protein
VLSEIFLSQGLDRLSVICPSCCFAAANNPILSLPNQANHSMAPPERFPLQWLHQAKYGWRAMSVFGAQSGHANRAGECPRSGHCTSILKIGPIYFTGR